ncbi:MAG: hypothetical protein VCD33_13200 [Alphaproteobacteria bacterium]|jgi:hypothetical protein
MEALFTSDYLYLWVAVLAAMLFIPMRQLIWTLTVRRAIQKGGEENVDDAEQQRLKRRASVTSVLLSLLFALGYVSWLFKE